MKLDTRKLTKNIVRWFLFAASAAITALSLHIFVLKNHFAPGGVSGIATIGAYLLDKLGYTDTVGWLLLAFNIPIIILIFIFTSKQTGIALSVYTVIQTLVLNLAALFKVPQYEANELIFAVITSGVLGGFGYAIAIRTFGIVPGTYAISVLVSRKRANTDVIWLSYLFDSIVVVGSFFVYDYKLEPIMCTLIELFISNLVTDLFLRGFRYGYKYEIVTDTPDELAKEIMEKIHHGVTRMPAVGMYTQRNMSMLVCIVRKRQMGEFTKILKKYPSSFVFISRVNEVVGRFD